jgi:hypothetical protein
MHEQKSNSQFGELLANDFTVGDYLRVYESQNAAVPEANIVNALGEDAQLLAGFAQHDIHTQAHLIRRLQAAGLDSEAVLRQACIAMHHNEDSERLDKDMAGAHIDQISYRFQRGHIVELLVETPNDNAVSRSTAALFQDIWPQVADGTITGVQRTEPPKRPGHGEDELLGLIHQAIETLGADTVQSAMQSGRGDMLRAAVSDMIGGEGTGHRVMSATETEMAMMSSMPTGFGYGFVRGVIKQVPDGSNADTMILADGREVRREDVRVAAIVGADIDALLDRSEDEVYYGKRVRVWAGHDFGWVAGTVVDAGLYRGNLIEVRTDIRISDSDNLDGHGFTVNVDGPSIDTRDFSQPPRKHPLEDYPGYEEQRAVTILKDGAEIHGYIDQLSPNQKLLMVQTATGSVQVGFDEGVTIWPKPSGETGNAPVGIGDTLARYNLASGRLEAYRVLGVRDDVVIAELSSCPQPYKPRAYEFSLNDVQAMQRAPLGSQPKFYETFDGEENDVLFKKVEVTFLDPSASGQTLTGTVISDGGYPFFLDIIVRKPKSMASPGWDPFYRYSVRYDSIQSVTRTNGDF